MNKTVPVSMPARLWWELAERADESGVGVSVLVAEAIEQSLAPSVEEEARTRLVGELGRVTTGWGLQVDQLVEAQGEGRVSFEDALQRFPEIPVIILQHIFSEQERRKAK